MQSTLLRVMRFILCGVIGAVIAVVVLAVLYLDNRPDLELWQTVNLDEEFHEGHGVETFEDYLALEERLFTQLDERVYKKTGGGAAGIHRYRRGSLADPERWERNWNRTFELSAEHPEAGVLLVHGLTDSPYSLRALALTLRDCDAHVVGIRVPGHGTVPSALVDVTWQDMAAAVQIGVDRVREKVGDRPVFIVGYSNGGALAIDYALRMLEDDALAKVDRIALLSPAIGVARAARFAVWQGRLGRVLGLRKLAWNAILPEYDPFKYNSFPVNGADQVYRLTKSLHRRMEKLESGRHPERFPPVLAFQSAVDATVSTPALIEVLFEHLPAERDNELVLFDLNRLETADYFLTKDPDGELRKLLAVPGRGYDLTVITNRSPSTDDIVAKTWEVGASEFRLDDIGGTWPENVYSLSHIALPFRRADPLYGDNEPSNSPGIALGDLALRGERGVLVVTPNDQLRLHWNPFYSHMERRILDFLGLKVMERSAGSEPRLY